MKTVPDVKKIAAKSFFGSIPCQKVEGVFFLFSACTLIKMVQHHDSVPSLNCTAISIDSLHMHRDSANYLNLLLKVEEKTIYSSLAKSL